MLMEETLFYSMASVIIFGLAIGTMMTLGAVPALCLLFLKESDVAADTDVVDAVTSGWFHLSPLILYTNLN